MWMTDTNGSLVNMDWVESVEISCEYNLDWYCLGVFNTKEEAEREFATFPIGNILLGNGTGAITSTTILPKSNGGTGSSNFFEQGTWTPSVASSGSTAPSVSYGYRYGAYYRVGNLVYVACHMNFSISSVGSNYACIKGLPFAVGGGSDKYSMSQVEEFYAVSSGGHICAFASDSTSQIDIRGGSGSAANTWVTGSGQYIGFCGCYIKS